MSRSLRVRQDCLDKVKLALRRNGFPSQSFLAAEVGFSVATVSKFLTGKAVDFATFEDICQKLELDWREIANLKFEATAVMLETTPDRAIDLAPNQHELPRYPTGSVPLGSPFYLERTPLQTQIDREIGSPGAMVRIKAPREMGKTSLLLRIIDNAKQQGYRTVSLNLEQFDRSMMSDLDRFLRSICANIARQLQIKPCLDDYWDADLGSKISCTYYFQEYLLQEVNTPLVLAFDELNQIFEYPEIAKDFLPLLRSWYEESKTLPMWQKLRLIVVHSTEIYIPLQLDRSPFNIGLPVQLNTFCLDEVQELAQRYGLNWGDESAAKQLMYLVSGHPALVQIALYHLSQGTISLLQLLETAATASGVYANHLQRHWATLQHHPPLSIALRAVVNSPKPISLDSLSTYKLVSMGLIKPIGNHAMVSCELYRQYFTAVLQEN